MTDLCCTPLILQLLVVVSSDWNASDGVLYRYQRSHATLPWNLAAPPIEITLGEYGMAWGRGLYDLSDHKGLNKTEGDRRSPAGMFSLGTVFGDVFHRSFVKNMPFLLITEDLECVDDPDSLYYNQFITASSTDCRDWTTSEKMKEIGFFYTLGLVVQHNLNPIEKGKGSAIFIHIWEDIGKGTAGCTAMDENNLIEIVSWLNKDQYPCLVQLPFEEYINKQAQWGLPELQTHCQSNAIKS